MLQKGPQRVFNSALRTRSFSSTANWLLSYPQTQVTTLDNGLRVASEKGQGETATVGVWIDAGSRFETPATNGVAHFLEHMSFKGTKKRSRVQLEKEVENLGGHLNAYTSREQTVFYAKVNKKDVPQAMDILADMLTDSQYTEDVVNKERDVILREMQEVNSQMEEVIFERLHETAYRDSMLGKTILGPEENIRNITRAQIADYVSAHYTGPRMVVAGAGAVEHDDLVQLSDKLLGNVPTKGSRPVELEPAHFTGSDILIRYDDMPVAHIAYAFPTAGWTDPDTYPLLVIASLLGNFDRNSTGGRHSSSELIANITKEDLAHSLSTFNTQYSDTGLFGIYGTCDAYACNQLMFEITKAMTSLCYNVDNELLEGAKNILKMNLLSQHDGSTQICEEIGRQMLTYGRRMHPTEVLARIDAVDENAIKLCANRFFYDTDFALAAIGPIDELPDYNWLRRKTYWLRY
jgi:processing peptidase subunit beta